MGVKLSVTPSNSDGAHQDTTAAVAIAESVNISVRPVALVGARIPSRQQHTRDLVVRVYEDNPHLQRADLWAVTRYCELSWKFRRLAELQERMGDFAGYLRKEDMEPKKILAELRALSGELLRHELALGLIATGKAGLGVSLGRMRQLAKGGDASEAEVAALEQRIVTRLSESHQGPQEGQHGGGSDDAG